MAGMVSSRERLVKAVPGKRKRENKGKTISAGPKRLTGEKRDGMIPAYKAREP
jgi:hypothetical protein